MELNDLSPEQLADLKNAVSKALLSLIKDEQDALLLITTEMDNLNRKERELWDKQVNQTYPEAGKTMNERMAIKSEIAVLESGVMSLENVIFCLENGGTLSAITDRKGKEHNKIPDFRKIDTNQIYFDIDTILIDKRPIYIPKINENSFRQRGYVFDAIRLEVDSYILAIKKHSETEKTDYVLVTLDQLVLISDYYYTKAKATLLKEAQDATAKQLAHWDAMSDDLKIEYLVRRNGYNSLPAKIQKEISREDYLALDWREREKIYKFYKRYSPKRITSKLGANEMWISFHEMYERFIDPTAVPPKKGYGNSLVFDYWHKFSEMMNYKINDIQIQRDDLSEMRKAAIETSFGESNTNTILKDKYGILVKRQNGDAINPIEIEQIKEAFIAVQQKFGNLKEISSQKNIKISHTGVRFVFASKAMGMYVPSMGTIAVSDKYGNDMFKMVLAHEYAHFIDNYIGELNGKRYATDDYENTAGRIAFLLRDNMNKPKSKQTNYTNATKECFARAFEQYFGIETFGEDAGISFSDKPLDKYTTFFSADDFVNKAVYTNQLKPLIEQFFTENADIFKYGIDIDQSTEPIAIGTERNETLVAEAIEALQILFQLSDEKDKERIEGEIDELRHDKYATPELELANGGEVGEEVYKKWKTLVNMSKGELEKFYNSEEGKEAGLSSSEAKELGINNGRESARWIMKMKDTPVSDWTDAMWKWANKQISFISRMSGVKGLLYDDKGNKTRKHTSLLIWGHNPVKHNLSNGGEVKTNNEFTAKTDFYFEYVPLTEIEKYKEFDRETEVRFDKSELDDLTDKIKKDGIIYPITLQVYNNEGLITEGNHRIAAAKRLNIKNIPVKVEPRTRPFKGTVYENKVVKLPQKMTIDKLKVFYPEVKLVDIDNSAAYYGFTKINNNN